jgi:hypothetical protein
MSDDYWFVQHNFKVGDDLVNVRGRDVAHLVKNAEEYAQAVGVLAQLKANIAGGQSLGQIVQPQSEPTQPIVHPSQQQAAQPPAWAQPSNVVPINQQGGEVCDNSDGKSPAACGLALQPKQTRTGKNQLVCPQYRYSSGQGGNGHKVVWL